MRKRVLLCIGLTAVWCVLAGWLPARPLPQDARVLAGQLDNGVKWMYRQHDNPPGKMALMIHVDTGSLNETDPQRGLAHFLEHMAFNGSEHFPPGKLVPYFESIGMEFGPDLNAYTSFDQTVYLLFTPDTKTEQIDKALMVLSDYAFRMSLLEEEINKERNVVLEEARAGKNAFQRLRDKLWPELFTGTRFGQRLPIGDEKIIASAPRNEFVEYYRTWYRPEKITVFLVGDASPDPFIPLIKKWFGDYRPVQPARKELGPGFKPFIQERALVVTDPEMAYCQVQMLDIRPGRPPTTTVEQWRTELVEGIGSWIIGRRFDERVKKGEASYRGASAYTASFFHDALLATGSATGEAKDWAKMLEEIIVEVNRAREFGFTDQELRLAGKELLAAAERGVRTESTRNAQELINEMVAAVNDKTPVLSAQQNLALHQELLPAVQLAEVTASFKDHFAPGTFAYVVTMANQAGIVVPPRDEVLAKARAAWARKVEPIKEEATPTNLLAELPQPGKVVETTLEQDLGITSGWLVNGVRFHHRFMDYKKDAVLVSISLVGGNIEETADNVGITEVATLAVNEAATSRLTSSALRDLMTGKNINVSAAAAGDAFLLTISGSPVDLEAGLQEACALLTDGRIEDAAFANWKLSTLQRIEQREKLPQFKAHEAMEDLLSGGDPRRLFPKKANIEALSVAKAQGWFSRLCRQAPIEVAVVGELQWDKVQPLIERYLGSLPTRDRSTAYLDKLRRSPRPAGPLSREVKVETVTPQAVALTGFAGCEGRNAADSRALELAANILSSRFIKKIREELGLVYSISAYNVPAWIYEDAGRFYTGAPCDPANAHKVVEEVQRMFQDLADHGPTAEELDNAKKQIDNHLDSGMREPSYWWGILRHHDLHRRNLAEEKQARAAFQAVTAAQVQSSFKKYYQPSRSFRVTAVPTSLQTGGAPEK